MYLGVGVADQAVYVTSSLGQQSSITSERLRSPEDWIELATYGVQVPERNSLLACVAVASGTPRREREEIVQAARMAGWDGVLLASSLHAAGRALDAGNRGEDLALVVVDAGLSSVGILRARPLSLRMDDHVNPIPGRQARELAVSLRCLLKERPRVEVRRLQRRVIVAGDSNEVERIGRRRLEEELETLGFQRVDFELDPFLVARGAALIARETEDHTWRRLRRRWR